jgi:hypothetical protein
MSYGTRKKRPSAAKNARSKKSSAGKSVKRRKRKRNA